MSSILVIEDDPSIRSAVQRAMTQRGHAVALASTGMPGLDVVIKERPDVVLLDLGLPDVDGLTVIAMIRAATTVPIIVITARDDDATIVKALDTGADDYVVKPVDLEELAARLRALVRRSHGVAQEKVRIGELELDPAAHTLHQRGELVPLAAREYDLLHALMLNAGRVLTREQLEQHLYSWGQEVESNAIEVHIHHLRRKLGADAIQTVRGVGYSLRRPATP
jgi:two-component system, OmpR family, response regulator QseB